MVLKETHVRQKFTKFVDKIKKISQIIPKNSEKNKIRKKIPEKLYCKIYGDGIVLMLEK